MVSVEGTTYMPRKTDTKTDSELYSNTTRRRNFDSITKMKTGYQDSFRRISLFHLNIWSQIQEASVLLNRVNLIMHHEKERRKFHLYQFDSSFIC